MVYSFIKGYWVLWVFPKPADCQVTSRTWKNMIVVWVKPQDLKPCHLLGRIRRLTLNPKPLKP